MTSAPRVTLVGAGPGDPDLLTLRAARAIASADVLLVDDLVDRRVLALARTTARVIEVGKRGGCASTPQDFIERLMVHEARAGQRVVRVKGGDPFVFGRGAEERDALLAEGVAVDVVPGITSGTAAPGVVGIPVTDRRYAAGVIFVTGHAKDDGAEPDWRALAATGLTLVIYMGIGRCAAIAQSLIAGGLSPDTPAAAIQHAHTPRQRALRSHLARLADDLHSRGIGSPAILVIGDVVKAARALDDTGAAHSPHTNDAPPLRHATHR